MLIGRNGQKQQKMEMDRDGQKGMATEKMDRRTNVEDEVAMQER